MTPVSLYGTLINSQTSEIQARQPILITEQARTSTRFRVISFLTWRNMELLRFFARKPIVRPIPVPAREPSASTMRISKAFIPDYLLCMQLRSVHVRTY